jgi:magnesium transporter
VEGKVKSATIARPRTATSRTPRPRGDLESQENGVRENEQAVLWEVGHASDDDDQGEDEDIDHHQHPLYRDEDDGQQKRRSLSNIEGEEGIELVPSNDEGQRRSRHSLGKNVGSWPRSAPGGR